MTTSSESFPRLRARTQRFTLGEPRTFSICAGGQRLLFLRSAAGDDARTGLWVLDLADGVERAVVDPAADDNLPAAERMRRERVREGASGVVSYAADSAGRIAAFALGGRLHVVEVDSGELQTLGDAQSCFDPRPDPTGRYVAYVDGGDLRVVSVEAGDDRVLATDSSATVSWGRAEFVAAEEMNRYRGFWWAPDGGSLLAARVDEAAVNQWWIADPAHPEREPNPVRYPAAGTPDAEVTLWVISLDGTRREVEWDHDRFPYLGRVFWSAAGSPLLEVVSGDQQEAAVLSVNVATGATAELHCDTDDAWVDLIDGVPFWFGEQVVRVATADGGRRLFVGDEAVTPVEMYVRSVAGSAADGIVFTSSDGDPSQIAVRRWSASGIESLTPTPGVHRAVADGPTTVISSATLDTTGTETVIHSGGASQVLTSHAVKPDLVPTVRMLSLGSRGLSAGLVLPRDHQRGTPLPVLLDPYGGPGAQRVLSARAAWLEPQWLADQGFAVLVADNRGAPGRSPAWEREIYHDFAGPILDDQVEALHAAAEREPDLDLSRVGIRGWSFGGWLAALAVLRRPDVFSVAIAGAPVIEWALYDTYYTERFLGTPQDNPDAYRVNSLLDDARSLDRPLLVIHGLADDNVVSAHTLRFSQRLTESGRPHSVLPLTGVTHMTPQEAVAENLLLLQVEFLLRHLGAAPGR
ncbi:MAG TPA: prolyl oligopeptidase family serine peptidase [Mycobacteriales bacterium]|nr:prolyl oligopeptidase family serine peptidase [Mycobacteriales bacterium]